MASIQNRIKRRLVNMGLIRRNKITQENRQKIQELLQRSDKLHVGCGEIKIEGFINIDFRHTIATDISGDCRDLSFFDNNSFSIIYSHAFFEHLYKDDRVLNLSIARNLLKDDGCIMYIGFPDFRMVAQHYLKSTVSPVLGTFDLEAAYRYTHGAPEGVSWWTEQLHKSLFDTQEVIKLLNNAGYSHYCIFNYSFRDEKLDINLGFIAYKTKPAVNIKDKDFVLRMVRQCTDVVDAESITILN